MGDPEPPSSAVLEKPRHIRYWLRCLRTLLPTAYTSQDCIRTTLGFFIVSALDILSHDEPDYIIREDELYSIRQWALSLQHPDGGFYGEPSTILPPGHVADQAGIRAACAPNLAATFFCLLLIAMAATPDPPSSVEVHQDTEPPPPPGTGAFNGVHGRATIQWLQKLQRQDGSFGEYIDGESNIRGSRDMRYTYMAAGVRWMLRRGLQGEDDINVPALKEFIVSAQTYDGGIAEDANYEAHGGYGYCAVATMALLSRPPDSSIPTPNDDVIKNLEQTASRLGIKFSSAQFLRWLSYRQLDPTKAIADDESEGNWPDMPLTAFNGRSNKAADSCYTWWASGALHILGLVELLNVDAARAFLLSIMQHHIAGGFSKVEGDPPDIYHSYLGLLSVSLLGSDQVKPVDAAMATSQETARKIVAARDSAWNDGVDAFIDAFQVVSKFSDNNII